MAADTSGGSFSKGLGDVSLGGGGEAGPAPTAPREAAPLSAGDFGVYPVLPGDNTNASAPENDLDYSNPDA